MTTTQIIIIIILTSVIVGAFIYMNFKSKNNFNDIITIFPLIALTLLITILCSVTTELNKLKKNHKCFEINCPEYEKVENVYKLKEK